MDSLPAAVAIIAALGLANLGALGMIWYKLGIVESRIDDHLRYHHREED